MKRQELLSVLITFAVGFAAGIYLYVTGAASFVTDLTVPDVEEVSEFSIVGDVYGGCLNTCPSFQVVNDGSYRYLYTPSAGSDQVIRQGSLPRDLQKDLRRVLIHRELVKQSQPIEPATCNSYVDGIDVTYSITLDGLLYELDSCGTAVNARSEIWTTLGKIWSYYETLGNNR